MDHCKNKKVEHLRKLTKFTKPKLERMTKILCSPNPLGVGTRIFFQNFGLVLVLISLILEQKNQVEWGVGGEGWFDSTFGFQSQP